MSLEGTFVERVQKAIADINAGRMVILVDDEDRENEGDLVCAADMASAEAVNFMAAHARGLICLDADRGAGGRRLGLPMMVDENRSERSTAFTVSIEAREGVTTGISAADRARTIRVASSPLAAPRDIVSPGHLFPLRARAGGVLQRTGHTEGSVDLARLAGRAPAAVICEIMNDDGTMARKPELLKFEERHGLHILTIEDLEHYRLQRDRLVHKVESLAFRPAGKHAMWNAHVYEAIESRQFLALTLGELSPERPTLVRMHTGGVFAVLFAPPHSPLGREPVGGGAHLSEAMQKIEAEREGVVVYIPPHRIDLVHEVRTLRDEATPTVRDVAVDGSPAQREFGLGAQVLLDLGLRRIRIMTNNPRKFVGLHGYGLEFVDQVPLAQIGAAESHGWRPALVK